MIVVLEQIWSFGVISVSGLSFDHAARDLDNVSHLQRPSRALYGYLI